MNVFLSQSPIAVNDTHVCVGANAQGKHPRVIHVPSLTQPHPTHRQVQTLCLQTPTSFPAAAATVLIFTLDSRTWTAGGHSRASQWPDQAWLACVLCPDSVSSLLSHHVAHSPGDPRPGPASASPHHLCPLATASSFRPNSVAGETFLTRPGGTSPRPPRPGVSVSSWVFLLSWLLSLQLPCLLVASSAVEGKLLRAGCCGLYLVPQKDMPTPCPLVTECDLVWR